jgi:hypothetical protein
MNVLYMLALLCSPLAVAMYGTTAQATVNLGLWGLALLIAPAGFPGVVVVPMAHAVLAAHWNRGDQHLDAMVQAVRLRTRTAELVARSDAHPDVQKKVRGNPWPR